MTNIQRIALILTLALSLGGTCGFAPSAFASHSGWDTNQDDSANWYHWYRSLRGYMHASGGIACEARTPISFSRSGIITATTDDAQCHMSLRKLRFPLPENAPVDQLTLTVPDQLRALSRTALLSEIDRQLTHNLRSASTH